MPDGDNTAFGIAGDPGALRQGAAALSGARDSVRAAASRLGSEIGALRDAGLWSGRGANGFAGAGDRLLRDAQDIHPRIADAVGIVSSFAARLAGGQAQTAQAAMQANAAREQAADAIARLDATPLPPPGDPHEPAAMQARDAARGQIEDDLTAALARADEMNRLAAEDVRTAALTAAAQILALIRGGDDVGSVRWFNNWLLGAPLSGWSVATTPPAAAAGADLWSAWRTYERESAAAAQGLRAEWDQEVNSLALLYDRGEISFEALQSRALEMLRLRSSVQTFVQAPLKDAQGRFLAGGLPDTPPLEVLGYGTGGLGVVSDGLTIFDPQASGVDKGMSGANAVGTIAYFAPEALGVLNASTDWIPVAGEVVMLGTGLFLGGEWVYNNRDTLGHVWDWTTSHAGDAWNWTASHASDLVGDVGNGLSDAWHSVFG